MILLLLLDDDGDYGETYDDDKDGVGFKDDDDKDGVGIKEMMTMVTSAPCRCIGRHCR